MLTFLRSRRSILLALAVTCLALYGLFTRQSYDAEWMMRWNHVSLEQVQFVYIVFIGVLLLALPFATRIQIALQRGRVLVLILAAVATFLSISLLEPNQEHRLFVTPFSVWIIIAHIVMLAGVGVCVAITPSDNLQSLPSNFWHMRPEKWLVGLYAVVIVVLIGLHVASVGEFMSFDTPDEPWLASMATNYAENDDLSPSFIGSSYGSPDPVLPRYYWLMGLWLKPAGTSLVALRMMPLFILVLVVLIVSITFWCDSTLTLVQRLGGIVVLLSMSSLVRMSHNLRADVGLAVYGALMLATLLQIFSVNPRRKFWAFISGLALYIGLETIPFIALILAVVAGVILIIWLLRQRLMKSEWQSVVIYALGSALSLGLYAAVRFLPDIQARLEDYRRFNTVYAQQTSFATLRFPLTAFINTHLRFSLILSPVESVLVFGALILLWYWGTSTRRWLLMTFALALVIMLTVVSFTYGYWTLFVPLVAYAAAYALRSRRVLLISSFVVLPALVAVPINDMRSAIQNRPNQTFLESVDALTPHIPEGITIIGEDNLWFMLHSHRKFIGIDGFYVHLSGYPERTPTGDIQSLGVNALLCSQGNNACEQLVATRLFSAPDIYIIGNSTYLLYRRSGG